jgi:hypothetical protein
MFTRQLLGLCLGIGVSATLADAGPIAYVLAGSGQFGQMDLATGVLTPIGPIPPTIQYLVSSPNGSLLTMSFDGNLDSIDRTTGALSVIGNMGFADCSTPDTPTCGPHSQLSLGSAGGILYGTDFANNLYKIDPATANATLIGATGIPAVPFIPVSINPDGSFNFYDENLFDVGGHLYANFDAGSFDPATFTLTIAVPPALYQIDPMTGHATKVAATDFGLSTIFNSNGTIYGFEGPPVNQIVILNMTDGTTSAVSDIDPAAGIIGGAAPAVPEPGTIGLALGGLVAMAVYLRRTQLSARS